MPDLEFNRRRLSVLQHLAAGVDRYLEVTPLIAGADTRAQARLAAQQLLGCDEMSAHAITDVQLEQLTKERRDQLAAEIDRLKAITG